MTFLESSLKLHKEEGYGRREIYVCTINNNDDTDDSGQQQQQQQHERKR